LSSSSSSEDTNQTKTAIAAVTAIGSDWRLFRSLRRSSGTSRSGTRANAQSAKRCGSAIGQDCDARGSEGIGVGGHNLKELYTPSGATE
jgi:hypothetical protein